MTVKELMRRYRNGTPIEVLAELCDIPEVEINFAISHLGGERGRSETDSAIMNYYKQGLSDRKIAVKIGCSDSTIWRWRISNNLPAVSKRGKQETYKGL